MKEKYYYLKKVKHVKEEDGIRYNGEHRCGIVFLLTDGGKTARGVSLCNDEKDPFLRDEGLLPAEKKGTYTKFVGGKELARKRAQKALASGESSLPIQRSSAKRKVGEFMRNKSEYMPMLDEYETRLLFGVR